MKKVLLFLSSLLLFTGCSYDDSDLQKRIDDLDEKLAELAARVDALNSDLTSLRELIDGKRFISDVTVDEDGSYTLTLVTSTGAISTIRITNGEDGHSPKIGIKQDSDGKYYWTLDGEYILDGNNEKLPVAGEDGTTPQFKIEGGYWHVSYNDGESWQQLGQATGDKGDPGIPGGDSIFANVEETDDAVIFTLADGETTITIPRRQALSVAFTEGNVLEFDVDETKTVHYTITGGTPENVVKAELQNLDGGYTLRTTPTDATRGTIEIAAAIPTVNRVIVSVSDGTQTIMTAISVSGKEGFDGSTITVATPGTLADLLADYDKTTITELTVVGNLSSGDIRTLNGLPNLSVLDMEQVNLEELFESAFYYNGVLASVKLPKNLKVIGGLAFYECSSLIGNLTIPDGVTTIEGSAFSDCSGLTSLTLSENLTTIGDHAFARCSGLTDIYCKSTTPPQLGSSGFTKTHLVVLHVPVGCAEAYRTAPIWSDFSFKEIVETDFSDLKNIE